MPLFEGDAESTRQRSWLLYRIGRLLRLANPERGITYLEDAEHVANAVEDQVLVASAMAGRGLLRCRAGDIRRGLAEMEAGIAALDAASAAPVDLDNRIATWVVDALPLNEGVPRGFGREDILASFNARRGTLAVFLAGAGHYHEVLKIGEPHIGDPAAGGHADAFCGLGEAYAALGRPDAARLAFAQAWDAYRTIGHHLGIASTLWSEVDDVLLVFETEQVGERWRLIATGDEEDNRQREAGLPRVPSARQLRTLYVEGRWTEARQIAEHASIRDHKRGRQLTDDVYGRLARTQGDDELAWNIVREGFPQGPDTEPGDTYFGDYGAPLLRLAINLSIDQVDLLAARQWFEAHDRWLAWSGAVVGQADGKLLHARYHCAAGDLHLARQHANEALAVASDPRQPLSLLAAHRFLGQLDTMSGHLAAAEDHLQQALILADACAAPYERALTLLIQAELRGKDNHASDAIALLDEVEAICQPLDAKPTLARVEALRAALTSKRVPVRYPAGLTQREVEVLQLVASGLTDAEVAERLYLSQRRITSYLTSIYTKLGVSSRTAAARFAIENHLA